MPEVAVLIAAIDRLLEASVRVVREERIVPIERRLTNDLALAFRAEGRAFLRGFRNLADPAKWPLDEPQWMRYLVAAQAETLTMWAAALNRAVGRSLVAGMATAAESMPTTEALREADPGDEIVVAGIRFDLRNPRAVAYLEAHGAELVKGIDETTRDYIRTVLVEGTSKGWSYGEMARRISDRYKEFAVGRPQAHIDSRAHMIAVTEVGNAYSEGTLQVAQGLAAAGLKMEKAWHTVGDDWVEAICLGNEAEGWIPLEQTFSSGHMRPLAHPACRCAMMTQRVGATPHAVSAKDASLANQLSFDKTAFENAQIAHQWIEENRGQVSTEIKMHGMTDPQQMQKVRYQDLDFYFSGNAKPTGYAAGAVTRESAITGTLREVGPGMSIADWPPELRRHTRGVVLSRQKNKDDSYWEKAYNLASVTSHATGGDGWIVVYNDAPAFAQTLVHEMAHSLAKARYGATTVPVTTDFGAIVAAGLEAPINSYAARAIGEDFAESVAAYVFDRAGFARTHPLRYRVIDRLMRDAAYGG